MSGKALKILIYVWGAICLLIFVAIRFEPVFNGMLKEKVVDGYWDKTEYGEMYYFSMISHFREKGLPPAQAKFELSEKHSSVQSADILTFGDSFYEFSRHKQFPERVADDFSKQVHYVNDGFPIDYLKANNYKKGKPKLLIYERTERFVPVSFEKEHIWLPGSEEEERDNRTGMVAKLKNMIFYDNSEELFNVVLKRSYITTDLYSFFATLKFDLFGSISSLTPAYYVNNPDQSWLFYHDQVNEDITSFYYKHSDEEMDSICNYMEKLANTLREEYNLVLVYLPIPAKYTLYHGLLNDDSYNNFLPRLYEGLEKRGVRYVNIYDDYKNCTDTLYYRTDSHWNQLGIDMAYAKTIEYFEGDSLLNSLLKE